jgi:hypothetical protein
LYLSRFKATAPDVTTTYLYADNAYLPGTRLNNAYTPTRTIVLLPRARDLELTRTACRCCKRPSKYIRQCILILAGRIWSGVSQRSEADSMAKVVKRRVPILKRSVAHDPMVLIRPLDHSCRRSSYVSCARRSRHSHSPRHMPSCGFASVYPVKMFQGMVKSLLMSPSEITVKRRIIKPASLRQS